MSAPIQAAGRLIVWRWDGDIIAGCHLRNFEVETDAACEALRLLVAGEEPKRVAWCTFPVHEGACRDANPDEVARHFRWRVYENWKALRDVLPPSKAKRLGKKAKVTP